MIIKQIPQSSGYFSIYYTFLNKDLKLKVNISVCIGAQWCQMENSCFLEIEL